jgi:hypothetical protein
MESQCNGSKRGHGRYSFLLMSGQVPSSTTYKKAAFKIFVEHRSATSHQTKRLACHSSSNGYPSKATQWFFKAAYQSNPMVFKAAYRKNEPK